MMMPAALFPNTHIPHYPHQCPPCYQFYYFPSSIAYPLQQNSILLNLHQTPLLNSQFLLQDQPLPQMSQGSAVDFAANPQNSINEVAHTQENHSFEQINMPKEKLKQKFGRNIKSNIFGSMLRFVRKQRSLKAYVRKIIQKHEMAIKITDFYYLLNKKLKNLRAYLTQSDISAFFDGQIPSYLCETAQRKEKEFRIIFRIVHRLYLHNYHLPYLYNTRKIKQSSKRVHLQYIRESLRL